MLESSLRQAWRARPGREIARARHTGSKPPQEPKQETMEGDPEVKRKGQICKMPKSQNQKDVVGFERRKSKHNALCM